MAEQITVTHWGVLMYGAPYAIAIEKGYYKELGLDIDGVLTSKGGGTTMRNVMASSLPYGEVALSAALAAMTGIDLKIIHTGVRRQILWATGRIPACRRSRICRQEGRLHLANRSRTCC
jgi:NitT/TauT family transport system substrate-binding protein